MSDETLEKEGHLFGARTADWYFPNAFSATARKDRRAISFMLQIIHPLALTFTFHLSEGFSIALNRTVRQQSERRSSRAKKLPFRVGTISTLNYVNKRPTSWCSFVINRAMWFGKLMHPRQRLPPGCLGPRVFVHNGPIETPNSWRGTPPTGVMGLPEPTRPVVVNEGGSERALTEPVAFDVERLYEHLKGSTLEEGMTFNLALGRLYQGVSALLAM